MILGVDRFPAARCFEEIDEAVRQLRGKDDVVFNAHAFPEEIPESAVVYNTENLGTQWDVYEAKRAIGARCVWDISLDHVVTWRRAGVQAEWVPIGYHPSMRRFERAKEPDLDVVFAGCINDRRARVFEAIAAAGRKVVVIPPGIYGAERDALFSRAKLCVAPRFYENGVFPALRVAHLVANEVPVLVEEQPDAWRFLEQEPIDGMALAALYRLNDPEHSRGAELHCFRRMPLELPC